MKLGKDLVLAIGGTPLAACRSCNIDKQQSFIPTASPTSGRWEQSTPERLAWSISADALLGTMAAYKTLDAAQDNGTPLTIRYYDTDYNLNKTGTAYIESLHLEGPVGSLMKMSVTLKGSGPLSTYGGTPIQTTLVDSNNNYYLTINSGIAHFNAEEGSLSELRTFTLSAQSRVNINPKDCLLILTTDQSIEQPFDDIYDFNLHDYGCTTYTELTEVTLPAGTYYVIFSYYDDATDTPELALLS